MTRTETAPRRGAPVRRSAPRWYQRVLPVTGVVLALVALAALAFPAFREQLVLSTSHRAQPYVELYFARTPAGTQMVCSSHGGSVRVRFAVTSHLGQERRLDYDVAVRGTSASAHRQTGSARVSPGRGPSR